MRRPLWYCYYNGNKYRQDQSNGKPRTSAPDGSYWEDDNYALRATEPGSTIKLATLLSVLEKGSSSIDDMVAGGECRKNGGGAGQR
ncbi:MAG: hypothetical protein V9F01_13650 [Chitinophagaceae bacterium]